MTPLFVDTGGWIALLKRDDEMHARAGRYYEAQVAGGRRLLTTNYVIAETATGLRYDAGLEAAVAFRQAVERAVAGRRLRVVWINARLEREGWDLLEHYSGLALSLTDATSAAVARRAGVNEVFGFDRHFRALGFDLQPA